jgi:hypothetical protein
MNFVLPTDLGEVGTGLWFGVITWTPGGWAWPG